MQRAPGGGSVHFGVTEMRACGGRSENLFAKAIIITATPPRALQVALGMLVRLWAGISVPADFLRARLLSYREGPVDRVQHWTVSGCH